MRQQHVSLGHIISRLARNEKMRFALVGVVNTIVDFTVFLSLTAGLHVLVIAANIVSTSCAMAVSYMLNKKAVFGDTDTHNKKQIALFLAVTLSALWVIQPLVILGTASWAGSMTGIANTAWLLTLGKIIATAVSLVWNYFWYSKVVFRRKSI